MILNLDTRLVINNRVNTIHACSIRLIRDNHKYIHPCAIFSFTQQYAAHDPKSNNNPQLYALLDIDTFTDMIIFLIHMSNLDYDNGCDRYGNCIGHRIPIPQGEV